MRRKSAQYNVTIKNKLEKTYIVSIYSININVISKFEWSIGTTNEDETISLIKYMWQDNEDETISLTKYMWQDNSVNGENED